MIVTTDGDPDEAAGQVINSLNRLLNGVNEP
jgi:hypothetical protein